jgi:hypothetical protein
MLILTSDPTHIVHVDDARLCLQIVATKRPIVHPPADIFFIPHDIWVLRAMMEWNWHGKTKALRKTCPGDTLSTTNPTQTDPGLISERPPTKCLKHGMADPTHKWDGSFFVWLTTSEWLYRSMIWTPLHNGLIKSCPTTCHGCTWEERTYSSSYSFSTSAIDVGEWSVLHPSHTLALGKGPPVPIGQEAGWAPELVRTQRLEEKILSPPPSL